MRWRVRRRRRLVAAATVLALAAIVVFVAWPGPDLHVGSTRISGAKDLSVASRVLDSYHITYRVESRIKGLVTVSTQQVWVRRPSESRLESWTGAPPGRKRTSLTINALTLTRADKAVYNLAPELAPGDIRPDVTLTDTVREGYAELRETRRVAGRACRVVRVVNVEGSSGLGRVVSVHGNYSDECIDEAGLVLEEFSVLAAKGSVRRLAIDVDEHPVFAHDLFDTGKVTLDVRSGGGAVRPLTSDSRPPGDTFWDLGSPPVGFSKIGRYAVVPPQGALQDPSQRSSIIASVDDVWVRGRDVLIVSQGGTLGGTDPFSDDPGAPHVDVSPLGRGELVYSLRAPSLRVKTGQGRFVIVTGTIPVSQLEAVARNLHAQSPGTLVYQG